jgi:homocysteine S-methyltransferase
MKARLSGLEAILQNQRVAIIDGAMATELEARGCVLNDALWSARILLEQPELIRAVHLDYFKAGADVAITASYQATVEGFAKRGFKREQSLDLIKTSVQLAHEARADFWSMEENRANRMHPLIAGSVGPYGAYLADGAEYRGDYDLTEDELVAFHRPRVEALIAADADLLACETLPCLLEARALIQLLAAFPNSAAWFCFSARDGEYISNGEAIADCASFLDKEPQAAAIGINCTSPLHIPSLIRAIKKTTKKPVIVYPNSGEDYSAVTKAWHGESSCSQFGLQSKSWYDSGASLIGGCCRTTPGHIHELSRWVRQAQR